MKFLHLPTPTELGHPDDSLPSREWTPDAVGYTWEDWEAEVRGRYPVRFWLTRTMPDFFRPVWWRVRDAVYWLRCHVVPRYRYHLVDLRGVDPLVPYTHGYLDPCSVMRLAAWKALRDYVEKAGPTDPASWATPAELAEPHLKAQKDRYDEVMALYRWWMVERADDDAAVSELYRLTRQPETREASLKAWLDANDQVDRRDEEMFLRLAKLRPFLWT